MSQKSSLPQAASFVSQVLKRDILDRQRLPVSDGLHGVSPAQRLWNLIVALVAIWQVL